MDLTPESPDPTREDKGKAPTRDMGSLPFRPSARAVQVGGARLPVAQGTGTKETEHSQGVPLTSETSPRDESVQEEI